MPVHITPASANPVLDALTQDFLDRFPGPARSIEELRKRTSDTPPTVCEAVRVVDIDLEFAPDHISGRLLIPEGASSPSPVLVFFCTARVGDDNHLKAESLCRDLAIGSQIAVFCLDITEGQLGTKVGCAQSMLSGIQRVGHCFGLDGTRLAVAGDGVGANVAAIVSMALKDNLNSAISLQILFNPIFADRPETPSRQTFSQGPWITSEVISQIFTDLDKYEKVSHQIPTDVSVRDLTGMPPTLIITAENDIVRDEGEQYARKLMQAGVRVNAVRFLGTIHDFAVLEPLADTPAAQGAVAQAIASLKDVFDR